MVSITLHFIHFIVINTLPTLDSTKKNAKQLLSEFNPDSKEVTLDEITKWYNGYESFGVSLYNPWSIICCLSKDRLGLHWVNTSEDILIKKILLKAWPEMNQSLQDLMNGGFEKKFINGQIAYGDLKDQILFGVFFSLLDT